MAFTRLYRIVLCPASLIRRDFSILPVSTRRGSASYSQIFSFWPPRDQDHTAQSQKSWQGIPLSLAKRARMVDAPGSRRVGMKPAMPGRDGHADQLQGRLAQVSPHSKTAPVQDQKSCALTAGAGAELADVTNHSVAVPCSEVP